MFKDNLQQIEKQIEQALGKRAAQKVTGEKVTLVAVTKTHPAALVAEALAAGLKIFGENKVQEAAGKMPHVSGGSWHLIGHLQTNKVKKAVQLFDLIYSVDSEHLLWAIDKEAAKQKKVQDILLQVNIASEQSKFGLAQEELPELLKALAQAENTCLRGLMVIAPEAANPEEVRPVFRQGYEIFAGLRQAAPCGSKFDILSMGMSGDFAVAVEEGANNVRLGSVLFGKRDYSLK